MKAITFRNVVLALTALAILLIGYLLDNPAAKREPQRVAIGPTAIPSKAKKTKKSSAAPKNEAEPQEAQEPLRDPFAVPKMPPARRPLARLEELELSELRLVAIVRDTEGRYRASVEESSGIGFMLREGTKIGPSGSAVLRISQDEVVVAAAGGPQQSLRLRQVSTPLSDNPTALPAVSGAARARSQGRH